jgi:WD40 repeat protein/tRNA A-37 threonylcarbamoyl transferase component Bud32
MHDTPSRMTPAAEPLLAAVLLDQCRRWRQGERVLVEAYLEQQPALRADADTLLDLLYNEVLLRQQRGEVTRLDEYVERFPELAPQLRVQFALDQALRSRAAALPAGSQGRATLPAGSPAPASPADPDVIGGYRILGVLGRGGMGVAYKAVQPGLKRLVALKMIRADLVDAGHLARFRTEAEAVGRLQHPNIVQVHEVGEHEGRPYLVLEYVEGGDLAGRLDGTPQVPRRAAELVEPLARAVHAAHQHGIVHRDLKPANILLAVDGVAAPATPPTVEGTPKITDFGLAKLLAGDESAQTESGAVLGTPSYMAPEQAAGQGKDVGPAADTYALGAILYELLTGRPPFKAETPVETLRQVLSQEPVPVRRLQPGAPRDLETICLKCLEKDPRRRYVTALELAEELERFLHHRPIRARPLGPLARAARWGRRNPVLAGVALLAAAALLTAAGVSLGFAFYQRQAAADIQNALTAKEAEQRQASRSAALLELDRGQALCEQDDVAPGLFWLVRGLEDAIRAGDTDLECYARLDLGAWGSDLPTLRSVLEVPERWQGYALAPDARTACLATAGNSAHLWDLETGRERCPPLTLRGTGSAAAFSPDGHSVAIGDRDGFVQRFDVTTGQPLGPALAHPGPIEIIQFSPDGHALLTRPEVGPARLWETETGRPLGEPLPPVHVGCAAFSPESRQLVVADENTARVRDARTGAALGSPLETPWEIAGVCYAPDGRKVFVRSHDSPVWLWDPQGGGIQRLHSPAVEAPLTELTQAARDPGVWMGFANSALYHCDPQTGETLALRLHGEDPVTYLATSPDSQILLAGSTTGAVRLWQWQRDRVKAVRPVGPVLPHPDGVTNLALGPTGSSVATYAAGSRAGRHDLLRLWDVHGRRPVASRRAGPDLRVTQIAFRPDGRQVLFAGQTPQGATVVNLRAFEPAEPAGPARATEKTAAPLEQVTSLSLPDPVQAAAFSPDGRQVATGAATGRVSRWDTADGKLLGSPLDTGRDVLALAFSPRDPLLAVGTVGGAGLWRWDQPRPAPAPVEARAPVSVLTFSPDGRFLAVGKVAATALWDVDAGRFGATPLVQTDPGLILRLAWSPDGRTLLTGSFEKTLQRWDATTAQRRGAPLLLKGTNTAVAFSPDSSTFVTGSVEGFVQCWDTGTGRMLGPPLTLGDWVSAVAFTPDGRLLLTATYHQHVCSWTVPAPLEGDPRSLVLWLNAMLGVDMDEAGALYALDAAAWRECRRRLAESDGPPAP